MEGLRDPGKFLTLDTKLLSAISKAVKGELARQIVNYKESEAAHTRAVRGRQVLWMFEQYFKTNEEVGALYSVEDLLKVSLINDDLSSFIHNWESVIAGISHVPEELTFRDILLRQIRGSHRLKYDLETYDRAKEGTETRSYQFLLTSIKNLLTREHVRRNRNKIAKAHGAKYGAPAPDDGKGKDARKALLASTSMRSLGGTAQVVEDLVPRRTFLRYHVNSTRSVAAPKGPTVGSRTASLLRQRKATREGEPTCAATQGRAHFLRSLGTKAF